MAASAATPRAAWRESYVKSLVQVTCAQRCRAPAGPVARGPVSSWCGTAAPRNAPLISSATA